MINFLIQDPPATQDPASARWVVDPAPAQAVDQYGQLERLASTFHDVDGLFYFTYVVCIFFFVLITAALAWSVVKYRRKTIDQPAASNVTHNTPLEVVWTVIPLIIVMVMFAWGWKGSLDMTVVPADARQYKAVAAQWSWDFHYPNDVATSLNEVWLEVDKPAAFTIESMDVLHAFFVPAMRVKRDVVPGRRGTVWFHPTEIGVYHLFCAEYCGKDHSKMYAKVHVVGPEEYKKRPWDTWDDSTPELAAKSAEKLYAGKCASCHTLNGMPSTGPSWLGLFIKNEQGEIVGGERSYTGPDGNPVKFTVTKEYITESIHDPNAKKATGFENANMSAFPDITERQINGIIEFMKTLAK